MNTGALNLWIMFEQCWGAVGVILMIALRDKSEEIVEGLDCNVKEDVFNTF